VTEKVGKEFGVKAKVIICDGDGDVPELKLPG
jgi:hypothetical protein